MTNASNSRVKPPPVARPRHVDLPDPTRVAADARHAGIEIGLMLEEVEMAPGHLLGVVGRAVGGAAVGTGEAAARRRSRSGCRDALPRDRSRCGSPSRAASVRAPVAAGWYRASSCLLSPLDLVLSVAPCSPPSRTLRAAHGGWWPAAILDRGCARRLGVVRPGRRNGPFQPNRKTSVHKQERSLPPTPDSEEAFLIYSILSSSPASFLSCSNSLLLRLLTAQLDVRTRPVL